MHRRTALLGLAALAACGQRALPVPLAEPGPVRPPRFGDSDPYPWTGRRPETYPVHGIDAARWQGPIDFRTAHAAGVNFAFLKATEGGDRLDPLFVQNHRAAREAGVRVGAYHFYYFCTPPEVQAAWFISQVPREAGALPPVIDLEWNPFSPTCTTRPPGADVRAVVARFADIVAAHYRRRPILYVTRDFGEETGIGALDEELWLRSVAGHPSETWPGESWSFWQYSSTGRVPGVAGPVDLNAFAGSAEGWRRWLGARAT